MAAFMLLAFLAIPRGVWGQTRAEFEFNLNELYQDGTLVTAKTVIETSGGTLTFTDENENFTILLTRNSGNQPGFYTSSGYIRFYSTDTFKLSASDGLTITSVVITPNGSSFSLSAMAGLNASTRTWTGSASEITFTGSGTNKWDKLTITYSNGGTQPTTYTVTYDCNGGTSGCPQNVTGIEPNTQIQLADAPSRDGFDFDGWSDGNAIYDENEDYIVNSNVTFTAQWSEQVSGEVQWVLTNLADLTENDVFVIVGNNGSNYAMSNNNGTSNAPSAVAVTVANGLITSTVASTIQWTISGNATNGYTFYPNGSTAAWLYCNTTAASSSNNNMRVGTGDRKVFELNSNNILLTKDSYTTRYLSIYNNQDWRGYVNTNLSPALSFYKKVTGDVLPPSITANNVEITYDTDADEIEYEINNAVDGGVLTAGTESDWLTLGEVGATVPFTCSVNEAGSERTATVTLTYTYNRATVTKDVTVTQAGNPNVTMTIAEVREQGTDNVVTIGTVTSFSENNNNTTAYIQDASAAIVVYGNFTTSVGDEIRVSGTLSTYHGLLEITNPEVTVISQGNTVNPEVMTVAEAVASTNQGWYIRIEDATVTEIEGQNTTIAQGENTIVVRGISGVEYDVNDVISLNGNIGCFDGNQIANPQNVEVQAAPAVPSITFNPDVVELTAEQQTIQIPFTHENIVVTGYQSFTVHHYDAEGEEIQSNPETPWFIAGIVGSNDEGYNLTVYVSANEGEARSAYMKVSALDAEENVVYSNLITINQAQYVVDYATLPFAYDGNGTGDLPNGFTVSGLGTYNSSPAMKFDGTGDYAILKFNERPGTLTFDIKGNTFSGGTFTVQTSEDGETYTDLKTYTELGDTQHESFTNLGENVRYIKWIYTEKVSGNVGLGNIALAEYTEPQQYTLTVEPFENLELITFVNEEMIMEGDGEITVTEGDEIMLSIVALEGYEMETLMVNGVNHVDDIAEDYTYTFQMPAENVTISATAVEYVAPAPSNYVRITALDQLTDGSKVIIAARHNATVDSYYAMKNATSNKPEGTLFTSMTSGDDEVVASTITDDEDNYYWTVNVTENGYTFTNASGNKIGYNSGTNFANNVNTDWTIALETAEQNAMVAEYTGFVIRNKTTDTRAFAFNGNAFGAYATTNMNAGGYNFFLDFFVETEPVTETYTLEITGYEAGSDGGYYLIASPVTVNPANVEGMTAGEYDLYSFDQAEADEWRNYKVNAFNLEPGKGYLYAKQATEPDEVFLFELTGTPYNGEPITLSKSEDVDFPGWNLVGNPYTEKAYIDRDFYVMNPQTGDEIITGEGNEIAAMQGFFVIADHDGEELEISTEPTEEGGKIVMNVNSNRGNIIDRAMVRFGEGRQLPKFMLNEDNTKLYIAKGEEEYAVARNEAKGEMNLNFEAAENGTYTLEFTVANVELDQLLLIDDKTGVSIDMLSTQSYTFEATTDDAAARFRIVFGATTSVQEENINKFAFYNNGNLIINNNGNAILNIVDVLGRIISSHNINGSENVSINAKAGVYMLQLIQGDKIQTQKIVVE